MSLQNKTFNELISFTRATGGGRFNASGQYEWLPANEPRIDYDPVSGECRGILIEGQRTNLLLWSSGFDKSSWFKNKVSLVTNAAAAPDGTMSAQKIVPNTEESSHYISTTIQVIGGSKYTHSIFLKAGELTRCRVFTERMAGVAFPFSDIDLVTGQILTSTPGLVTKVTGAGNGWLRLSVSGEVNSAATSTVLQVRAQTPQGGDSFAGDGTSGIYIWGAQLEAGAFPTSYTPTTTAQVTRAADLCSVNNLSPWYRADEGTLLVDFVNRSTVTPPAVSEDFACIADSSADSRISIARPAGASLLRGSVFSSVAAQADITLGTVVPDQRRVAAIAFKKDYFAASANGGVVGKDTSGVVPSVTKLGVGSRGINFACANGHIRRIRYIPRRISDTELQAITAL